MSEKPEPRTHLIWSNKWGRWHRRSDDGSACGYTDDILRAGMFETSKAMEYHGHPDRDPDNRAISLAEAVGQLEKRLEVAKNQVNEVEELLIKFKSASEAIS